MLLPRVQKATWELLACSQSLPQLALPIPPPHAAVGVAAADVVVRVVT